MHGKNLKFTSEILNSIIAKQSEVLHILNSYERFIGTGKFPKMIEDINIDVKNCKKHLEVRFQFLCPKKSLQ